MNKTFILIVLLIIFLSSCNYFKLLNNKEWQESSQNDKIDIYVTGYYFIAPNNHACYWKNGKFYYLPEGVWPSSMTNEISVHNNNIYIKK